MDSFKLASLANNIMLLARAEARVRAHKKFKLTHAEVYVMRVVGLISSRLKRDRIPVALLYGGNLLSPDASVSRTISLLEKKGYLQRTFTWPEKGKRRRFFIGLTSKGKKTADNIADYDNNRVKMMLDALLPKEASDVRKIGLFISGLEQLENVLIQRIEAKEKELVIV